MKSLFFKVKKVECNGEVYTGVVLPCFEQRGWSWSNIELLTNIVEFLTLNGEKLKFKANSVEFKTTRILDKKLKELIDQVIDAAKEEYKVKLKMIELNKEGEKLLKSSQKKNDEIGTKLSKIINCQGLLTEAEFTSKLHSSITSSYDIDCHASNSKLFKITLRKEHDLGKWIKDGDYGFLYVEYDGNICVVDGYEDSKQLKDIKAKYFKKLTANKICGYSITEDFYPEGGGDKRSAGVYQDLNIDLKNGIELKEENMPKVLKIFKELFANLK